VSAALLAVAPALLVAVADRRRAALRSELVARAAHEVRGPLAAAHLALQALARESGVARQRVAAVDAQLQRAAVALADLAAAPAGRRVAECHGLVEVGDLLEEQIRSWRPMAAAYGCELALTPVPPGTLVRGDRVRLSQALGNVIGNAIEHGEGRIELSARTFDGRVRVEVLDDGPGLPAPVADLAARPRGGRGARGRGLAIAADIAGRHGGRLASAPSVRGARLALELPAVTQGPAAGAVPTVPTAP
jgi:signal transduction histidine kinase